MTTPPELTRRTALTTLAGTTLTAIAGCLTDTPTETPPETSTTQSTEGLSAGMKDGLLVVNLADELEADHVNLIQPDGELYGKRDVAAGVTQVSFELGTTYQPGDYTILAQNGDKTTAETTLTVEPDLQITAVGLYRNHPEKPWDEVYGESETDTKKNGEAFVSVTNTGSGPDSAIGLIFTGDVPNPLENPHGNGMYEVNRERLPPGETVDLYSDSFPFGSASEQGMGCHPEGNSGEFKVKVKTAVGADVVSRKFAVTYTGSKTMSDCSVEISSL